MILIFILSLLSIAELPKLLLFCNWIVEIGEVWRPI